MILTALAALANPSTQTRTPPGPLIQAVDAGKLLDRCMVEAVRGWPFPGVSDRDVLGWPFGFRPAPTPAPAELPAVEDTLRRYGGQVRECRRRYGESELVAGADLEVAWQIVGERVQDVQILRSSGNEALDACIVLRVSQFKFPRVPDQLLRWTFPEPQP